MNGQSRRGALGAFVSGLAASHSVATGLPRSYLHAPIQTDLKFIRKDLPTARAAGEAVAADGETFMAVGQLEGIAEVRIRTANGSDPIFDHVTKEALNSATPGKGASFIRLEDGADGQLAVSAARDVQSLLASKRSLPSGSTIRTANGYIYEVLTADAPPFDEYADPEGFQLQTTGGAKLRLRTSDVVTPEMFAGDIHLAAAHAATHGLTLMTGPVVYEITIPFRPHDITWISDGTRIKQVNLSGVSCLMPGSNLKHLGKTYLFLAETASGTANRAHVLCGRWDTGQGIENFSFDEFVLEGGHINCNGFSVAGNSHNIRGRSLNAGTSTRIGRVFLAHWANFQDHYNSGGSYLHRAGASPTTHPYDIAIDEVIGSLELSAGDFCALWCVSAGYDIRAGRVSGSVINKGAGHGNLVLFTAGDLGLAYATPEQRAKGMWGLEIGAVTGYASHSAVNRIGRALHHKSDGSPQSPERYFVRMQDTIGTLDAEGPGSNIYCALDGNNGGGRSRYGLVRSRKFRSACAISNFSRDVAVQNIEAVDSQNQAIQLVGSGAIEADWPNGFEIGVIRVNGTGGSEADAGNATVSNINKIIGVKIGSIVVDRLKDIRPFRAASLQIGEYVRDINISSITLNWVGHEQEVVVYNRASADCHVDIGHISAPGNLRPLSGGVTSRVIGHNREYHYAGGPVPSGVNVRVGDRFVSASAESGHPWLSIVTTAGVTGVDAITSPYLIA